MRVIIDNKFNIGDEVCYFTEEGYSYQGLSWAKVIGIRYSKRRKDFVYLVCDDKSDDEFIATEDELFSDEEEALNSLI